ncbi:hypothetical protein CcaverHIS002_0407390 [Cutaneotrichosporon cavernicola]|uniref:SMP-30/Gluconolactonase/LRE-like region domain-containing protein n=1 Tax=Cutaneotrichosporon cavernicola TaxID=279322 RepID=A0AA48QW05_9TREE|nr:uncharacterized protein CcaverHIS019_0407390 [Cutaneotrichosporon cavernicola]BEI84135.1 hypothetical protein CcaverHIS002_0407390 [Cutaneotrichosporon cavernicola]BEI91919.1 hypothetical protein CcaverHIS019_0407390 [Cutaneotrichosporon cavernicola]BEI99690.1 hypothetical protein CcaverHIS631_0407330 [Cutaneotrichosporon cavernicola]BEJ07465.1 hypothetical protein CcaverHIS641_0407340 [Cutaneotrichosporon cavernicola]
MPEIKTIARNLTFTECPRWHGGRWWFSDFYTHAIYSMKSDGSDLQKEVDVPGQPSGLGWLPDGHLIFVSMKDRKVMVRAADGTLSVHADVSSHVTGLPNDMVVGTDGVAYLGNFGFDLMGGDPPGPANLLRIALDGTVTIAAEGLHFPNGSVITPSNTLIVDETFGNRVSAFDITPTGLGPRRDWAVFGPLPQTAEDRAFAPDGCGLDAEGALWIADARGGRVCRVKEGGEIVQTVEPGTGVFACMLGGEDGRDLIMCCAPDFLEHKRRAAKEAELRVVRVDVPRAGLP